MKTISSELLNQSYHVINHKSGLTIITCPMEEKTSAYALFTAKVGSIDTTFKTQHDADFVTIPEGIAHYLEHKMFESEEGDAFDQYAKTGASANAYTSFDRTSYLFSCTSNFKESLRILMKMMTTPYFTKETVEKEQGIIGQEIRMYDDSPEWQVMFNLLGILYHKNPVRIDIAGTTESISHITAELLHRSYNTFYSLGNMVLVIAGKFDEKEVMEVADEILKPQEKVEISYKKSDEPEGVVSHYTEKNLPVALPLFQMGFKGTAGSELEIYKNSIVDEILLDVICGNSTELYKDMYDKGLINGMFDFEVMSGRDYIIPMFAGESKEPKKVYDILLNEVERIKREGIDEKVFSAVKKSTYGRYLSLYCKPENVASLITDLHLAGGEDIYKIIDFIKNIEIKDLTEALERDFKTDLAALSVVKNKD